MSYLVSPDDTPTVELPAVVIPQVESPCETTLPRLLLRIEEPEPVFYDGPRPPMFGWLRWPLGALLVLLVGCGFAVAIQVGQVSVPLIGTEQHEEAKPAVTMPGTSTPKPTKPAQSHSATPAEAADAHRPSAAQSSSPSAETPSVPMQEQPVMPVDSSAPSAAPPASPTETTAEPTSPLVPPTDTSSPPATEESTPPPVTTEPAPPTTSESTLP